MAIESSSSETASSLCLRCSEIFCCIDWW